MTIRQAYESLAMAIPAYHHLAFVNAFHLESPAAIFGTLLQELEVGVDGGDGGHLMLTSEVDARAAFERLVFREAFVSSADSLHSASASDEIENNQNDTISVGKSKTPIRCALAPCPIFCRW